MRFLLVALPVLAIVSAPALGQELDHGVGGWSIFASQGRITPNARPDGRFLWWFDAQALSLTDSPDFSQVFLRPGVGYALTDNSSAWLGYAWFQNDPANRNTFEEHRVWEQYIVSTHMGAVPLSLRTRLEQRFVETGDDVGWRLRQFAKITPALSKKSGAYLSVYDELFIDINDTDWGADTGLAQNRLFAGVGWKIGDHTSLETGYMNQYLHLAARDDAMNHFLVVQLSAHY